MNDKSNSNNEEMRTMYKALACGDDGMDDNDDEKKPAAIVSSSSSNCVATTAAMEIVAINNRNVRQEISKSSSRCPQIKAGKNDNENEDISNINGHSNDNEDDDSFYDDWVEGNWCLLDNYDNNNNKNRGEGEGKDDENNSTHEIRHEMTPQSRKKTRNDNSNTDDDSTKRKSKRFRFHQDDDHNYEEVDSCNEDEEYKENNDDEEDDEEEDEEDSNDVQNHQEDNQLTRKRSRPLQIQIHQIWMGMFEKLVEYKKQHKNTRVPKHYDEHSQIVGCTKLGFWVSTQRQKYKNNKLLPNRIDLLNSIGFEWEGVQGRKIDNGNWMSMFHKLVEYKKQHKNTIVPRIYDEDPKLGWWVSCQRMKYKHDKLLPKRYALLNSVGFKWVGVNGGKVVDNGGKVDNEKWMNMFQKLSAYKEQHTNTMVPSCYDKDPKLGRWVANQRKIFKKDGLHPKRYALLNSIDFN